MSKIYNKLNNDFTQIPNAILQDTRISALAFKIYCYICFRIGRHSEWEFYNNEILQNCKEGRCSLMKAKKELIEYGYLEKLCQKHKTNGDFGGCDYVIYQEPKQQNLACADFTTTLEATTIPATSPKQSTNNNTDILSNNELTNTESNKKHNKKNKEEIDDKIKDNFNLIWNEFKEVLNDKNGEYNKTDENGNLIDTQHTHKCLKHIAKIKDEEINLVLIGTGLFALENKHKTSWIEKFSNFLYQKQWKLYLPEDKKMLKLISSNAILGLVYGINKKNAELRCEKASKFISQLYSDESLEQKRNIYQQFIDKVLEIIPYDGSQVMANVKTSPSKYFKLQSDELFGGDSEFGF